MTKLLFITSLSGMITSEAQGIQGIMKSTMISVVGDIFTVINTYTKGLPVTSKVFCQLRNISVDRI